mgnify:FL=1
MDVRGVRVWGTSDKRRWMFFGRFALVCFESSPRSVSAAGKKHRPLDVTTGRGACSVHEFGSVHAEPPL